MARTKAVAETAEGRLLRKAQEAQTHLREAQVTYYERLTRALQTGDEADKKAARGAGVRVLMTYMARVVREDATVGTPTGRLNVSEGTDQRTYGLEGYALEGGDLAAFPYPNVEGRRWEMQRDGLKLV